MNVSLTTELEKVSNVKSAVEQKAIANEEMYKTSQEFNNRFLPHNSCLQSNLETTNQAHNRLETEKSSIVEQLSTVRGHNKALQEQLASLKMDAEVISAGILREVLEVGELSLHEIRSQIGYATAHLVHESLHVKNFASRVDVLDDHNAAALRKFCLTYYDIRALILDLALKLDMMRHLGHLPRYQQQIISLQVMKIYAPLAHAVGTNYISLELEDLSFQYLFPYSYLYVDTWLRSQESGGISLIDVYKDNLLLGVFVVQMKCSTFIWRYCYITD